MMDLLLTVLAFLVVSVEGASKLKVDCGRNPDIPATIVYIGDARAVFAYANGEKCKFSDGDRLGEFKLSLGYQKSSRCRFGQSSPDRLVFSVNVESRLLHELIEGYNDESFVGVCNYMMWSSREYTFNVSSSFKPPVIKFVNKADRAKSFFSIYMVNIQGGKLRGRLNEKRVVKLRVQMKPPLRRPNTQYVKEVGFQPIQCLAEPSKGGQQMVILSDGCGTGFPWRATEGFTMRGLIGNSPKFRLFKLHRKQGIKISCHFVICTSPCNVNSCPAARRRRRRPINRGKRSEEDEEFGYLHGFLSTTISVGTNASAHPKINKTADKDMEHVRSPALTFTNPDKEPPEHRDDEPLFAGWGYLNTIEVSLNYQGDKTTIVLAISSISSVVLLITLFLSTYVLTKIHQTHQHILRLKQS